MEPLQAGESLRRRMRDHFWDKWLYWVAVGMAVVYEWVRVIFGMVPTVQSGISFSVAGGIVIVVAWVRG